MDRSDGVAVSPDLDLGRPQSQSRLWFEPLVSIIPNLHGQRALRWMFE